MLVHQREVAARVGCAVMRDHDVEAGMAFEDALDSRGALVGRIRPWDRSDVREQERTARGELAIDGVEANVVDRESLHVLM